MSLAGACLSVQNQWSLTPLIMLSEHQASGRAWSESSGQ